MLKLFPLHFKYSKHLLPWIFSAAPLQLAYHNYPKLCLSFFSLLSLVPKLIHSTKVSWLKGSKLKTRSFAIHFFPPTGSFQDVRIQQSEENGCGLLHSKYEYIMHYEYIMPLWQRIYRHWSISSNECGTLKIV